MGESPRDEDMLGFFKRVVESDHAAGVKVLLLALAGGDLVAREIAAPPSLPVPFTFDNEEIGRVVAVDANGIGTVELNERGRQIYGDYTQFKLSPAAEHQLATQGSVDAMEAATRPEVGGAIPPEVEDALRSIGCLGEARREIAAAAKSETRLALEYDLRRLLSIQENTWPDAAINRAPDAMLQRALDMANRGESDDALEVLAEIE